jgi:hypothetical protein
MIRRINKPFKAIYQFFVTSGNTPKLLNFLEETLHHMPFLITPIIIIAINKGCIKASHEKIIPENYIIFSFREKTRRLHHTLPFQRFDTAPLIHENSSACTFSAKNFYKQNVMRLIGIGIRPYEPNTSKSHRE